MYFCYGLENSSLEIPSDGQDIEIKGQQAAPSAAMATGQQTIELTIPRDRYAAYSAQQSKVPADINGAIGGDPSATRSWTAFEP